MSYFRSSRISKVESGKLTGSPCPHCQGINFLLQGRF